MQRGLLRVSMVDWGLCRRQRAWHVRTEMLFVLDAEHNLRRRPDVAFVSTARWPLDRALPETGDWDVVPDLAVEVISPNDVFKDVLAKVREYFHYGVQVVWVIAPRNGRSTCMTRPRTCAS